MRIVLLILLMVLQSDLMAADLPPIDKIMTPEEMSITGLDKLSAEERELLRRWLDRFVQRDAKFVIKNYKKEREREQKLEQEQKQKRSRTSEDEQIAEPKRQAPVILDDPFIEASIHIVGTFDGWRGKSRFTLSNGEVWEQRKPDSVRRVKPIDNPTVKFKNNLLGFNVMEVPAAKVKIMVKRVK
jgi:hypothetical protein